MGTLRRAKKIRPAPGMTAEAGQMKIRAMTRRQLEQPPPLLQGPSSIFHHLERVTAMVRRCFTIFAAVFAAYLPLANCEIESLRAEEPAAWAKAHLSELVELYRYFHAHPELSFEERETAARL